LALRFSSQLVSSLRNFSGKRKPQKLVEKTIAVANYLFFTF